ncbi:MAG: enoyl-CoA hydratase/isomerase family protein, partial [Dehalococcoidia bacterium]|nr:enoyl-CoA hydratase/isomerase family protein [Dehalococcoidia bacterium]
MDMDYSTVRTERVGDVGVITLNRPEKMNAINRALIADLDAAIHASEEDGTRALILTGAGRGFCAGADLTPKPGEGHTPGNETLLKKGMPLGYP